VSTINQVIDTWKVVLAQLRRTKSTWRGIALSVRDHATYTEAILCASLVLVDLSNRYGTFGTHRDHVNWAMRMARVDVSDLAPLLADSVVLWRRCSSPTFRVKIDSYNSFKRELSSRHPHAGEFLAPASRAIQTYFDEPSAASFAPPYQFFSFLTHLSLKDLDMGSELEDAYQAEEERLSAHRVPPTLVADMSAIMTTWFKDFRIREDAFLPKHGPGAVAELSGDTSWLSKYGLLAPDQLIEYVFRKHGGFEASTFVPARAGVPTSRQSAIVFVPKSMKTKRVISKEPATLMYFQQGMDQLIRKYVAGHPVLRHHIDLNDQSVQRLAAIEASATRAFATVDLSAASDCVSDALVREVFRRTPLYPFLVALRSQTTRLPSGKVLGMTKYAPMGSALCFPVETLIFACIAECTARYVDAGLGDRFEYHIYGDDIIVPDHHLRDLAVNLRWAGFRLNQEKTYGGDHKFRESCGLDAYDGCDVSPMKISRKFSAEEITSLSTDAFAGRQRWANDCQRLGHTTLRRYLLHDLLERSPYPPIFWGDMEHGVFSTAATNFHLKSRWSSRYQRWEVKGGVVRTTALRNSLLSLDRRLNKHVEILGPPDPNAELFRYFEWLRLSSVRTTTLPIKGHWVIYTTTCDAAHPDFRIESRIGSAVASIRSDWVGYPMDAEPPSLESLPGQ